MAGYDLQEIKNKLTEEQIFELLSDLGGEPEKINDNVITCTTICHNHPGQGSRKLYFYSNSRLCHCYTGCEGNPSFDIVELTQKVMSREHPKPRENGNWTIPEAIRYIAQKFGFSPKEDSAEDNLIIKKDLKIFEKYEKIKEITINNQRIQLKEYDDTYLNHLPHNVIIQPWIREGISTEAMEIAGICYNPKSHAIVIPHRDIDGRLIGIRERTLVKEKEQYCKYMPSTIGDIMYSHPLSYNLYNLNNSKENIRKLKKAIIFESEKSCLKSISYFGRYNDISIATCGSNLFEFQFSLLYNLGVEEIIIGFDRQYKEIGDEEYKRWVSKLKNISNKYNPYCKISFLFDIDNLLGYKDSPIDVSKEVFLKLFKNRLNERGQ